MRKRLKKATLLYKTLHTKLMLPLNFHLFLISLSEALWYTIKMFGGNRIFFQPEEPMKSAFLLYAVQSCKGKWCSTSYDME